MLRGGQDPEVRVCEASLEVVPGVRCWSSGSRGRGAAAGRAVRRRRRLPEPSPFLNPAQPCPVPAAKPGVTMNPAVFLSLPDLRCSLLLLVTWVFTPVTTEITSLDTENIDDILNNADVALVNFYADWCRFSQMLHPIFEEASNVIKEEYPNENQVVFARVDCDQHSDIAQRYRISKYPTLKLFRNGMMMKREYRGQRSVKALADYIRQQKSDPVQELHDLAEITTLDRSKRNIIGYFEQKDSENYRVFERVANILHDDCAFLSAFGAVSKPERYSGDNIIYKPPGHSAPDMVYLGSMTNFDGTYNWIQDKCVPLVREITFENGEVWLSDMCYLFKLNFYFTFNFRIPGKLKQFVFDLHSGKLHREFHHGPDPTDIAPGQQVQDVASSPPESSFQKLAPSEYRYTLLRDRDEL
eukprot:XP_022280731.1 endoplasmic reticulum resident protein 44 [Canis lupus familiaris]